MMLAPIIVAIAIAVRFILILPTEILWWCGTGDEARPRMVLGDHAPRRDRRP